ncbi:hypothetical protein BaRGS_00004120 [Batillaria attramentaria]|uniref:Uncharacterized protein n=1 Tax=Batillaria attramentaria TaxID=370345 RepID=A0ABD0LY70_9CAEN
MALTFTTEMKVCTPCLIVGFILFCVSFGSASWFYDASNVYYGLWKFCLNKNSCFNLGSVYFPDWLVGIDVLECIALGLQVGAMGAMILLSLRKHKFLSLFVCLAALGSGVLGAIGAAVFCVEMAITGVYVYWAFFLNLIGDVIVGLAGLGMLVNTVHAWLPRPDDSQTLEGIQNPLGI